MPSTDPDRPPGTPLLRATEGITITQAAAELGVHHQTIRNWIKKGALPVTRFGPSGGIVRIHPADLEQVRHTD